MVVVSCLHNENFATHSYICLMAPLWVFMLMILLQMVTKSPSLLVVVGTFIKLPIRYCQPQPKLHSCLNRQKLLFLFIHTNIHPMKCFKSLLSFYK
jgi:hypothetical protein